MLYALGQPLSLAILVASFILAVSLGGLVRGALSRSARANAPAARIQSSGRMALDPRQHVEPFGSIAALLAGFGWGARTELTRGTSRGRLALVVVLPAVATAAVGLGLLLAYASVSGRPAPAAAALLQSGLPTSVPVVEQALLLAGLMHLYVGALSVVPLPPLPGGQLLFALAPRTRGWQQAEYQLDERNFGTLALLLLMVLPISGRQPLLPYALDVLLSPIVRVVTGG